MGIREKLNENPIITTVLTIVILLGAGAYIIMRFMNHGSSNAPKIPTKAYYSDDDGSTWFVDDANKIPPFDHGGKQAVRAILFRCGKDGRPFVQRLEEYDQEVQEKIKAQLKAEHPMSPVAAQFMFVEGTMVKKPGGKEWIKLKPNDADSAKAWTEVMNAKCPDGTTIPTPVSPDENAQP